MRLDAEQLLSTFSLAKDYLAYSKDVSEWTITTDTITPFTPQRVEGIVDVDNSVHKIGAETSAKVENVVPKAATDSGKPEAKAKSDTLSATSRSAVDSLPKQSNTNVENTTVVESAAPKPVVVEEVVRPIVHREVALPVDTAQFSVIEDTAVVATYVASQEVETFSMEGHKEGKVHPVRLDKSDGIFALLLVCFLLMGYLYNGGIAFFKENLKLVFSTSKSDKFDAQTQTTSRETIYSFFLVFLAVLLISISLYEGLDRFMPLFVDVKRPFVTIGLFAALILVFIVAKMILNRIVGFIFDYQKDVETWNKSYLVLFSILGLLCFFPTLLLVYSSYWHSIIIAFVLILFLIVQIILFLRVIVFFIGQKFNLLYLIAYLCTIEILPYIFLGIGLVRLYKTDFFNTIL